MKKTQEQRNLYSVYKAVGFTEAPKGKKTNRRVRLCFIFESQAQTGLFSFIIFDRIVEFFQSLSEKYFFS